MKIGIVLHSHTGTTKEFAGVIKAELEKAGHQVEEIVLLTEPPVTPKNLRDFEPVHIQNMPDCAKYDVVLVGGPVWGFSATPVTAGFLKQAKSLSGKRVVPFVTMSFPFAFMGGNNALAQMSRAARESGAQVLPGFALPKMFHDVRKDMKTKAKAIVAAVEGAA